MSQYVLRFISGKDKGREYPLAPDRHIMIGRDSGVDLLLVDNKVSRQHAAITTHAGQVMLHDLESRNGTFVNDRRISTAMLNVGDELVLGSSRMRLETVTDAALLDGQVTVKSGAQVEEAKPSPRPEILMEGDIARIALPDLIQMLASATKTGLLVITSDDGVGRVHFRDGQVRQATLDHHPQMPSRKVFCRVIRWPQGKFELQAVKNDAPVPVTDEITESTTTLLFDALRQLDEMTLLESQLPRADARLTVATPVADRLQDLSTDEIQVYQLAASHLSVQAVVDQYPGCDLEACTCLLRLLRAGLVAVVPRD
jgi:hypothetical protein